MSYYCPLCIAPGRDRKPRVGEDLSKLKLWDALEKKATDAQRAMVRSLVDHAAPLLDRVIETFPTYTLHNADHARRVASLMSELIGDQLDDLRPLEAALLILSAFFHDIGMVFTENERTNLTSERDWPEFLDRNPEAFVEWTKAPGGPPSPEIAEWYCRWRHADRVYVHLERIQPQLEWGAVNLYRILGELCRSHNMSLGDLQGNLELTTDGVDGADLRFCAVVLRLADILDFDGSRSPESVYQHLGLSRRDTPRRSQSDVEWRKHLSSAGISFPEVRGNRYELRFVAGPDHPAVEYDVRNFLTVIEEELAKCAAVLPSCSDRWRKLPLPADISRQNIKSNGYHYGEYRFTLDQDRVLRFLMGENLYGSPHVFVRELLQNAIDTTRLRAYLERARGNVNFTPTPIKITQWTEADGYQWVRFDDYGVGMDDYIIRTHLLKVGSSYYRSPRFEADMLGAQQAGAGTFTPISRFGIGLLSCFIVCDRIEISTLRQNVAGERTPPIRLSLNGLDGFFVMRTPPLVAPGLPGDGTTAAADAGYRREAGTSIACRIDPSKEYGRFDLHAALDNYVLAPPVQVHFGGKEIGGSPAELADGPWVGEVNLSLTDEDAGRLSDQLQLQIDRSSVSLSVKTIDLDTSAVPELRGRLVLARLSIADDLKELCAPASHTPLDVRVMAGSGSQHQPDYNAPFEFQLTFAVRGHHPYFVEDPTEEELPEAKHREWIRVLRDIPAEKRSISSSVKLRPPGIVNEVVQTAFRARRSGFLLSHNGISVPIENERFGRGARELRLPPDTAAWGALFLADRLRPDLSVSRDQLRGIGWEIQSAITLAARRALKSTVSVEELASLDLFAGLETRDFLSLDRLSTDPLLRHSEGWQTEAIFWPRDAPGPKSLVEILGDCAGGADVWLRYRSSAGMLARGFSTPADCVAATLAALYLNVSLVPAKGLHDAPILHVRGPRPSPISVAERLFPPLTFLPFDSSDRLAGRSFYNIHCLNTKHPFAAWLLIPGILNIDPCPRAMGDGLDALRVTNEKVPGILASGDDCLIAVPHQAAELVATQIVPDVLHRVEFW